MAGGEAEQTKRVGVRLRDARRRANLSQEQIAEVVQVRQATISRWETGKTSPTTLFLDRYCQACGVSTDRIVRGIDAPNRQLELPFDPELERLFSDLRHAVELRRHASGGAGLTGATSG